MAITDSYATVAQYRGRVPNFPPSKEDELTVDLAAVSRFIEKALGRFFNVDDGDVTRIYTVGNGSRNPGPFKTVWTHDIPATPTTIRIDKDADGFFTDESALGSDDYVLVPENAALGPEVWPYEGIQVTEWGDESGGFTKGARVEVVGTFGWPAVPSAVVTACVELTRILRLESPRANSSIPGPDVESVVATSPQAQAAIWHILKTYKRDTYGG